MLIELTKQQQQTLIQIINKATIQGQFAELIVELRKAILDPKGDEQRDTANN